MPSSTLPRHRRALLGTGVFVALAALLVPAAPAQAATVTLGTVAPVIINEVNAVNFAGARDETNKRADWVELYNPSGSTVDLAGWGLSSSTKNPFRWVFPNGTTIGAGSYLRVWASGRDRNGSIANLHTNFNLDNGADSVALSAPNQTVLGQLVDSVALPRVTPDTTICRIPSGVADAPFLFCRNPSIGAANGGSTATSLLATPTLSLPTGVYSGTQQVTVTGPAGAELRYTTDGSEPTGGSTLVTGPITVSSSLSLRVAAFAAGALPSFAATASYAINPSGVFSNRRLVFVTMNPADRAAYTGAQTAPLVGWRTRLEMIDTDGTRAFSADAVGEDAGQIGSRFGQKTMGLDVKFLDALGQNTITYPIFSDKPTTTSFKRIRLRNGGNDATDAHLRDQFWHRVGAQTGLITSAWEPAQVFVNGSYYGMMELREKEDESLIENALGVDKDDVDYLSQGQVLNGDRAAQNWDGVVNFLTNNDLSVSANYSKAKALFDVETFAKDWSLHFAASGDDWIGRNTHYFGTPSYDGRWRYRPHDLEISAELVVGTFNTRADRNMNAMYDVGTPGALMRALLRNRSFKLLYTNIIADGLNTAFQPSNLRAVLDETAAEMEPYLPEHIVKTNGEIPSISRWRSNVDRIRTFVANRGGVREANDRAYLGLGARVPVTVGVNDPAMGTVQVNSIVLGSRLAAPGATWTGGYWPNQTTTLTAAPALGYRFVRWEGGSRRTDATIRPAAKAGLRPFVAVFEPLATAPAPVVTAITRRVGQTGQLMSVQVKATDPTGYRLTYKDKDLPPGLDIQGVTGLIYGKPSRGGDFVSTITVTNGLTSTAITVTWRISNSLDRVVVLPQGVVGNGAGLTATYSNDANLGGTQAVTRVEAPSLFVGTGVAPQPGFGTSNWSVRWTGTITAPVTGTYTLGALLRSDDGARVIVAGTTVVDAWTSGATSASGTVALTAGVPTPITVEFVDKADLASLTLTWVVPGIPGAQPIIKGVFDPA